jgi:hypothetical protein
MNQLKIWLNPEVSKVIEYLISGRESMVKGAIVTFSEDNSEEPTKFYETYNYPELDAKVKWRVAIR